MNIYSHVDAKCAEGDSAELLSYYSKFKRNAFVKLALLLVVLAG